MYAPCPECAPISCRSEVLGRGGPVEFTSCVIDVVIFLHGWQYLKEMVEEMVEEVGRGKEEDGSRTDRCEDGGIPK